MPKRAAPHRGLDVHYGHPDAGADAPPSRSQLKRESDALQKLGEQVCELNDARLEALTISDTLRDAITEYQRTKTHEGRRRQRQFIGKLMHREDADALREAVAAAQVGSVRESLLLHTVERWRAELMADDGAFARWMDAHPDTDSQQLRSLVRAARRDSAGLAVEARQPRSQRELFQYIKPWIVAAATGASPEPAAPEGARP